MVSREQAGVFRKHRTADDKNGNLLWAMRLQNKALRASPEAAARDIEALFELDENERLVWRILRLPRKYMDLELCGVFNADEMRGVLRGFIAADVVGTVKLADAKALIPAEVKRLRAELQGKAVKAPTGNLVGKVFRPEIDAPPPSAAPAAAATVEVVTESVAPTRRVASIVIPAEKKLRESLLSAAANLGKLNHYAFLGIPHSADDAQIRAAYVGLARDYHPDRLAGTALVNDDDTRDAVDKLFKRLGDANKTLTNAESRARYDRELALLEKSENSGSTTRPRRPTEARNAYMMGESFFKKKDYKQAETHYRQAVMFDGEEALIGVALAWCIFLNPDHPEDHRIADAKRRLEEILKKQKSGEAAYRLGRVLREAGDENGARRRFEEALQYQPGHVDAQRELRLAENRRQKAQEEKQKVEDAKKGLLGKLFKK
jgi:curved DNA-binding protein CbpA